MDQHAVRWFESYLGNRRQRTICNNVLSTWEEVEYGVPQGSILGPLLFIIYVNDLPNLGLNSKISLYADDTLLIYSHKDLEEVNRCMQSDMDRVSKWCNENKLTINPEKSQSMLISRTNDTESLRVLLKGKPLQSTSSYKYLGVMIDSSLSYEEQFEKMAKSDCGC